MCVCINIYVGVTAKVDVGLKNVSHEGGDTAQVFSVFICLIIIF